MTSYRADALTLEAVASGQLSVISLFRDHWHLSAGVTAAKLLRTPAEVLIRSKQAGPQGLKPTIREDLVGTAEAVPYPNRIYIEPALHRAESTSNRIWIEPNLHRTESGLSQAWAVRPQCSSATAPDM